MSRAKPELVAFNAGEYGEETLARIDLENYPRGAEVMENIIPMVQGGMTKAPGTQYIGTTPSNSEARMRPFISDETERFFVELSANKLRFIRDKEIVQLAGAAATIGAWSDESAAVSTGGGAAPSGGTGDVEYDYSGEYYGIYA